jgi:hypothetical protein
MGEYSALKRKPNDPSFAAKCDDVTDENYFERADRHAGAWDRCATLRPGEAGYGAWMAYLETYAPNRHKRALDAVAKRGYYTFPDRHPADFDIRAER